MPAQLTEVDPKPPASAIIIPNYQVYLLSRSSLEQ